MSFYRLNRYGDTDPRAAAAAAEDERLRADAARVQVQIDKAAEEGAAWEAYKAHALEVQRKTADESYAVRHAAELEVLEQHKALAVDREAQSKWAEQQAAADERAVQATAYAREKSEAAAAAMFEAERRKRAAVQEEARVATREVLIQETHRVVNVPEASIPETRPTFPANAPIEPAWTPTISEAQAQVSRNYTDPNDPNYIDPSVPLVAWDQQNPSEAIPTAMPDGTVAVLMQAKTPYLAIFAAAGGGFIAGGPLGALIGAGLGYWFSKPKTTAPPMAWYG